MPSTGETRKAQMRAYSKTPEAKAKRAANQRKWRDKSGGDDYEATPDLKINPAPLLSVMANWK